MYVLVFVLIFGINFSLYQAELQNYGNQGFQENGSHDSINSDYTAPPNDNQNRNKGQNIYSRHFDGQTDIINIGNGDHKKNVFIIDDSPNRDQARPGINTRRRPNPDLNNRFGSDAPIYVDDYLPRTFNSENTRGITRIKNIGNGVGNRNTFIIHDDNDDDGERTVTVLSPNYNNNRRPTNTQRSGYHPNTKINQENINRGAIKGSTKTHTYNIFGQGPGNKNVVIIDDKSIRSDSGLNLNNYGSTNPQRNFNEGDSRDPINTQTYNRFDHGPGKTNVVNTEDKPIHSDSGNNLNNHRNTNPQRNFNEGDSRDPINTQINNRFDHGPGKTYVDNIENKPIDSDYGPNFNNYDNTNRQINFKQVNNKGPTDIYTYNRIGQGIGNKNVVIMNGKPYYSDSGISVTTIEHRGQGEQKYFNTNVESDISEDKLRVLPLKH